MFTMTRVTRTEPIACRLDGEDVRRRVEEFREVFELGYVGGARIAEGVRWRFRALPGLEADLRSLAEREQACCRFFRFDVRAIGSEIWWDSRVDDAAAQPILEDFFALPAQIREPKQRVRLASRFVGEE